MNPQHPSAPFKPNQDRRHRIPRSPELWEVAAPVGVGLERCARRLKGEERSSSLGLAPRAIGRVTPGGASAATTPHRASQREYVITRDGTVSRKRQIGVLPGFREERATHMPTSAEGVASTESSLGVDRSREEGDEHAARLSRDLRWKLAERLAQLGPQRASAGAANAVPVQHRHEGLPNRRCPRT